MTFQTAYINTRPILRSILFAGMLFACFSVGAQQKKAGADTAGKTSILILGNQMGEYLQNDSNSVHKLLWDVKLLHGSDTLYCDSAFFYTKKNSVEAFGDVVVRQADGTEAFADYMRYTGNNKTVYMRANRGREVQLSDGKENSLWSRDVDYNLVTKVGKYKNGGYLQSKSTQLSSNTGEYNMKTKEARFRGDVDVADPEYRALSTDLGYNTDSRIARFFGPSIVTNDKSVLQTSNGVYDTKNRTSHFVGRSSILNEAQYIEGDTLDYDRNTGYGIAIGNVIAIDSSLKITLYCGQGRYNEINRTFLAFDKPIMRMLDGKDSMFIRYDTFYSAPDLITGKVMTAQDSLQQTASEIQASVGADSSLLSRDSSVAIPANTALADSANNSKVRDSMATIMPVRDTGSAGLLIPPDSLADAGETTTIDTTNRARENEASLDAMKRKMDAFVYKKGDAELQGTHNAGADTLSAGQPASERKRAMDSTALTYNNMPQQPDTAGPRYFVGYRNVLIYSDSLQGKCDSIRYSQADSLLRMYINPVLWPNNGQLKGDIIYMQMDSSKLKEVFVPRNAIMISRSGPEKADMFDQVQGNYIRGFLTNNKLDSMIAEPNASSIYFITDDDKAYVGSSEAKSERIEILFEGDNISRIYYRKDVEQKTTPMKDVTPSALRLSRFDWREKERPKSLEEFLQGIVLPPTPDLLGDSTGQAPAEGE